MKNYFQFLKGLDSAFRKNAVLIFLGYFFVLLSYPSIRSVSQSLFYEHYTAQDYSLATFFSVLALIVTIFMSNKIQEKIGAQKLYVLVGVLSFSTLVGSYIALVSGSAISAFVLFAIKESYIVLLLHLILAYANATFSLEQIKRLYGPLGASGALGGILGGMFTSYLSETSGVRGAFIFGICSLIMSILVFAFTKRMVLTKKEKIEASPLRSIKSVKKYVFLIAGVVAVSQWVIFMADLQFNILFEDAFTSKGERTSYLGKLYSYINTVSLVIQFVILPWLMVKVSVKKIFFAVPILFLFLILGGMGLGAGSLWASAFVFISLKGTDYSVFNIAKEVMYYPLDKMQKFGAKYITDMFIYRLAKALIAFVMAQYLLKDMWSLNLLQAAFISLWLILLVLLFKEQKRVNKDVSEKL